MDGRKDWRREVRLGVDSEDLHARMIPLGKHSGWWFMEVHKQTCIGACIHGFDRGHGGAVTIKDSTLQGDLLPHFGMYPREADSFFQRMLDLELWKTVVRGWP